MQCQPYGPIGIEIGAAVQFEPDTTRQAAALTIQARAANTGQIAVVNGNLVVADLAAGQTWTAPTRGGNDVQLSAYKVYNPAGAAATQYALITAWTA
jgi:hypothetical protein